MCTYPAVNRGLSGPMDRAGAIAHIRRLDQQDIGHPTLSGLEEFDGDLFALDVGQHVRAEQNRKGICLR